MKYSFSGTTNLRITVPVDANIQSTVGYNLLEITFSVDSSNFTG